MKVFKQILIKLAWVVIYLAFNVGLFFIEISFLFKKESKNYKSNTGSETLDALFDVGSVFLNVLDGLGIFIHGCICIVIAIISFLIFIPIQFKHINPQYQGEKYKFLYSILAAIVVIMTLKLLLYIWMLFELYY